jgi:uroporphyrinogen-III decarboxylase
MTPRERWLAACRMQPVDRLPFWPKLNGSYPRAQASPFSEMENRKIHEWIGSDQHVGLGGLVREVRNRTSIEAQQDGNVRRTTYTTPHGSMEMEEHFDKDSQAWHPVRFPVTTVEDIRLMTEMYEDVRVEPREEQISRAREEVEDMDGAAVTTTSIGTSALMRWIEWIAGVENAHYLLADHEEDVLGLFAAMHRVNREKLEIALAESPSDLLYLVENTSTTLASPDQYRRYCFPHIAEYACRARELDRLLVLHMCGCLKALLPDLAALGVAAFEAFTSPTLGDTTLLDGRSACPDVCLIGGTNAMLWTKSADEIIRQIEADLEELPHHRGIVVTSAGVMPPLCKPETIRTVCEWVKAYPVRCS